MVDGDTASRLEGVDEDGKKPSTAIDESKTVAKLGFVDPSVLDEVEISEGSTQK